jgi:hypothetical protein
VTSKLETELVKASGFKPPKGGYKERQDHLAALARLANKLTDKQFDELSDDAANWVTATIHSIRDQEEIKDFDDADEETESADEADDDGAGTDHEDDAEAESENEAKEATQDKKASRTKAVASKSAKSAKPSPKQRAEPEEAPKKKERITTTRYDNIDGSKDKFGLVIGTKTWEAVQMYEKGCTTAEIKDKLGGRYYNILKILEKRGHRVERFPGGKFKVTHAEDRKRKAKE